MEAFGDIFTLDNMIAIMFLVFLYLWHSRTVQRDKYFHDTMTKMIELLSNCQDDLKNDE